MELYIFSDASVNKKMDKSVGSFIILDKLTENINQNKLNYVTHNITSSTMAEMLTIRYTLNFLKLKYLSNNSINISNVKNISLYTDCLHP